MTVEEKQLVNVTNAAKLCGFKCRTGLYYYIRLKKGPLAIMVGGMPYFDKESLLAWNQRRMREQKKKKEGEE